MSEAVIPYDDIDLEIRKLVKLINSFEGIRTTCSCAGHSAGEDVEIVFISTSQGAVETLFQAFPFWGSKSGIVDMRPKTQMIWASVSLEDGSLLFSVHLSGSPFYRQRELLATVEISLESFLLKKHLPYSNCECPDTQGTV